jgi:hypothetical protein
MGVPFDDFLDFALDRGQRAGQQRYARGAGGPFGAAKAPGALEPVLAGNRSAISIWSELRILTPKKPYRCSSGQEEAPRLMLTIRVGGSTDNDDTEVTVIPAMSLPRPTVMTLTPPARWRMAPRKSLGETW